MSQCVDMAYGRKIRRLAIGVMAIAILIALFWLKETLIWRDGEYWRLVEGYKRARSISKQSDRKKPGFLPDRWHESLSLPNGITATVEALDTLNPSATVRYSDARTVQELHPARDYTTLVDLRTDGSSLYVLRSIALFGSEQRLVLSI
jgi:hypothetical protein